MAREGEELTRGRVPNTEGMGEDLASETLSLGVLSLSVACMVRRGWWSTRKPGDTGVGLRVGAGDSGLGISTGLAPIPDGVMTRGIDKSTLLGRSEEELEPPFLPHVVV